MKQRLYLDTSVFGGYYDKEFSEQTIPLFNAVQYMREQRDKLSQKLWPMKSSEVVEYFEQKAKNKLSQS